MKALSIHAPYIHDIITGSKKEEYRTWKPKEFGRILLCSSAKRYPGYASGYALCTVEVTDIRNYPGEGPNGRMLYGWVLKNIEYIEPFPVKGKLHLFDVDDSLIKTIKGINRKHFLREYYTQIIEP